VSPAEQEAATVYRIGFLGAAYATGYVRELDWIRAGLSDRGYAEGRNLVIEYRWAEGNAARLREIAAEFVGLRVDAIVTHALAGTIAAAAETATIPIVMADGGDPVAAGLAASLARPGGNVTGLTSASAELVPRRLELLKALVPKLTRVAAYSNLANVAAASTWKEIEIAASAQGFQALLLDVRSPEQIASAFDEAVRQRAEALIVGIETLIQSNLKTIVDLAARHRLPAMYAAREFVEAGGLMSYGVSYPDLYYRAADFADRILKGANPGELPIERPAKFSLFINRRTARALDVVVPPDMLLRAERMID
jgi:putative ABC transport system substrate-binding protein